ncbi:lymphocyte antigen 6 complex locus protein G6d-like [Stigmatopora nigra]
MNRILLQIVAVGVFFAVGQALQCYECKIGFWNLCITKKVMCAQGERCFSGKGKAARFVDISMKGCLAVNDCNKTYDVNFPSTSNSTLYKITKTCCNSNLCNAAPGVSSSAMVVTTIFALLFAHIMV